MKIRKNGTSSFKILPFSLLFYAFPPWFCKIHVKFRNAKSFWNLTWFRFLYICAHQSVLLIYNTEYEYTSAEQKYVCVLYHRRYNLVLERMYYIHLVNTRHSLSWVLSKYTTVFFNLKQGSWRRKREEGETTIFMTMMALEKRGICTKCHCTAAILSIDLDICILI